MTDRQCTLSLTWVTQQGFACWRGLGLVMAMTFTPNLLAQSLAEGQEQDLNEPSGWLQLELAVLTDTRPQTLESEFWPPYPEVGYPGRFRWLENISVLDRLKREWPDASIEHSTMGAITLRLPDPDQVITEAVNGQLAAQAAAVLAAEAVDTIDASTDAEDIDLDPLAIDDPSLSAPAIDDVALYTEPPNSMSTNNDGTDPAQEPATEASAPEPVAPPPLPTPFRWRQPEQLAEGLNTYLRATPDRLRYQAAWLQPPKAANVPILLDLNDDTDWPELQGFVQLRRGQTLRLGINLWLNTLANYYPQSFSMAPPPPAPTPVSWRAAEDDRLLTEGEAGQRQQRLVRFHSAIEAGVTPMSFVDQRPYTDPDLLPEGAISPDPTLNDPWPWRHVIHVADTRTLPENTVRYFDHPVIKVIATWRELNWGELYALGEAERLAACEASTAPEPNSVGSTPSQCNVRVGNATSAP